MLGLRRTAALTGGGLAELNEKMEDLSERFETLEMDLRAHTTYLNSSRDQILYWLDAHFTIEEYDRALSARLQGTCTWVLNREAIRSWKLPDPESTTTKFLWIHGLPGFGKTVLCATLIEYLCLESRYPTVYFFCSPNGNHIQDPQAILRSWVAQLVLHGPDIHPPAVDHFRAKHARTATEPELWSLLQMLSLQLGCCYFVIDGFELCVGENPCTEIQFERPKRRVSATADNNVGTYRKPCSHRQQGQWPDTQPIQGLAPSRSPRRTYCIKRTRVEGCGESGASGIPRV